METRKIDESVAVGGQPTGSDVQALARQGFRSIVNLRTEGEEDQPLSPQQEGKTAEENGLRYAHIPISLKNLAPEQVESFRSEMESLPKPVYIHCRGGTRAAALLALHRAVESGEPGDAAMKEAERIGAPLDTPEYRKFFEDYVVRHFEKGD